MTVAWSKAAKRDPTAAAQRLRASSPTTTTTPGRASTRSETTLTPSNVKATHVRQEVRAARRQLRVRAAALRSRGSRSAARRTTSSSSSTESNSVYAFDANASGSALWHTNVGTALSCSDLNDCGDLVPGAGITGTPVIDPTHADDVPRRADQGRRGLPPLPPRDRPAYRRREVGGPVDISPTAPGTGANSDGGTVQFDPGTHYQRCALLLSGGVVYVGIGSNAEIELGQPRLDRRLRREHPDPDDDLLRVAERQLELALAVGRRPLLRLGPDTSTPRRPTARSTSTPAATTTATARSSSTRPARSWTTSPPTTRPT